MPRQGFTLIQLSILLTVGGLVLVASLPAQQSGLNADMQSSRKLDYVLDSLHNYLIKNGRLPCPSDPSQPTNAGNAGITAQGSGIYSCKTGTPSVPLEDTANQVAVGGVPYKTLGISSDYALDGYGRAISYHVDTNAVKCWNSNSLGGAISITDNSVAVNSVVALVSHGKDGHGAWIPLAGTSGSGARLNSGSSDVSELTNAHVNSSFNLITPANSLVKQATTATFDDFVTYRSRSWNINQLPLAMQGGLKVVTPANGTYKYGSVLSFKLIYPASVTVTGTPRLKLSAITGVSTDGIGTSNVAYANYSSGSGSPILTFNYTVGAVDSASQGIQLTPSLDLNGGSITVTATGNPACPLTFIAPNLSGVIIYQQFLYAVDYTNYQVKKFDLNGNLKLSFGSFGTSDNEFTGFAGITVDTSGNIWVSDNIVERLQKFTNAGAWQMSIGGSLLDVCSGIVQNTLNSILNIIVTTIVALAGHLGVCLPTASSCYCSAGILSGQFNFNGFESGIALDASGNLWVPDHDNNRVQEFNTSTGAYIGGFTMSLGAGPSAIAIDSSGYLWITSYSHAAFYKCTTAGSCSSFTAKSSTYAGIAFDAAGNFWVTDNKAVHKYNASGVYQSDLSATFAVQLYGIAIDASGNIWLGDHTNSQVVQYTQSGTLLKSVAVSKTAYVAIQ